MSGLLNLPSNVGGSSLGSLGGLSDYIDENDLKPPSDDDDENEQYQASNITEDMMVGEDDLDDDDLDDGDALNGGGGLKTTKPSTKTKTLMREKEEEEMIQEQRALFEKAREAMLQKKKKVVDKHADHLVLYTDPREGQVLKFTDLFGPKQYDLSVNDPALQLKRKKVQKKKRLARKKSSFAAQSSSQYKPMFQDFNIEKSFYDKEIRRREETYVDIMRRKQLREQQEKQQEQLYQQQQQQEEERWRTGHEERRAKVQDTVDDEDQLINDPSNFGLLPFDQIEWERDIIWGNANEPYQHAMMGIDDENHEQASIDMISDNLHSISSDMTTFPMAVGAEADVDSNKKNLVVSGGSGLVVTDSHSLDFMDNFSNMNGDVDELTQGSSNVDFDALNLITAPIVTHATSAPLYVHSGAVQKKAKVKWGQTEEDVRNQPDEEAELLAFKKLLMRQRSAQQAQRVAQQQASDGAPAPGGDLGSSQVHTDASETAVGPDGKKPRKKYTRKKKKDDIKALFDPKSGTISPVARSNTTNFPTVGSQHLQHIFNEELLSCEWLDRVTWDNDEGPKKPLCSDLVFDLNDPDMIFEEINPSESPSLQSTEAKKAETLQNARRYNVANDSEYADSTKLALGSSMAKGRHIVRHSIPALKLDKSYFKMQLKDEELRRLHRPRIKFKTDQIMPVLYRAPKKEKKSRRKTKIIEKKMELSAHDHRLILVEYIEQKPSVLNNTGMGTKICNYFKKGDETSLVSKCEDGVPYLIDSQDSLPLLGPLKNDEFFTSTENSMFSAQLHKHQPPSTDFLLTTRKTSGGLKFYIRPIPMYYTAGHTQPNTDVPAPNSRAHVNFCKNRLNLFIYRRFKELKEKGKPMKLQIDDVKEAFPTMPETTIRKCLKQCAHFKRGGGDSGWWYAKPDFVIPSEEDLQAMVTPEMVCLNESMSSGQLRLQEAGVNEMACMASYKYSPAIREKGRIRDAIRFVEKEEIDTPWNKTTNFLNALSGKENASLHILSVVNQNLKKEDIDRLSKETEAAVKSEAESILPTITDTEARKILAESGESDEKINAMTKAARRITAKKVLAERGTRSTDANAPDGSQSTDLKQNAANKKDAKEIARNAKFRQVLQNIFTIEAYKLSSGIEYYTDIKEEEAMRAMYPSRYMIDSSSAGKGDAMSDSDDEDDEALFEDMMKEQKMETDSESDSEKLLQKSLLEKVAQKSTTESAAPAPPEKRYIVRKTKTIKLDDGTTRTEEEIIKDPTLVNFYMEKKRMQEQNKNKKKGKRLSAFDDESFKSGGKEARRLQDMYRRYMKTYRADGPNSKKKRRSTLAQQSYQESTSQNERKKERLEKQRLKKLQKLEKAKEKKTKQKKGNTAVAEEGGTKFKIKLSKNSEKPLPKTKDTPAQSQGLKIQIPASVIEQSTDEKPTKKRKQSAKTSASASTARPPKKPKTTATKPPALPIAKPVVSAQKEQEYMEYLSPKPQTSRRRKTTGDQLAEVLSNVLTEVNNDLNSNPFKQPVDPKQFADYRKVISHPMDLSTMSKKVANLAYMDDKSFRMDFERMIENSIKYCTGRFPNVVESAKLLLNRFNSIMASNADKIEKIRSEVNTPVSATHSKDLFDSGNNK